MTITTADIKTLREMTNAGMMDCKSALLDAKGDLSKAQKLLKERGVIAASMRSGRSTNEGRIACAVTNNTAAIIELGCETDFVARTEAFIVLASTVAEKAMDASVDEAALAQTIVEVSSTLKENIQLQRKTVVSIGENELVSTYLHGETAGVGALVKLLLSDSKKRDEVLLTTLAHDIALHAAAFQPLFVSPDKVSESHLAEQKEIIRAQIQSMNKPENIIEKIADGKLKRYLTEVCLTEQAFVKNDKISVAKHIATLAKEIGCSITLQDAIVYKVGTK